MTYYTVRFENWVSDPGDEAFFGVDRVTEAPRRFWLVGRRGPPTVEALGTYRGACTVWHRVPDGKCAPTWLEDLLADAWTAKTWVESGRG